MSFAYRRHSGSPLNKFTNYDNKGIPLFVTSSNLAMMDHCLIFYFWKEMIRESRPNSHESRRLYCLGWSIICRLDKLAWVFQVLFLFLLWFYWVGGTVVVHCPIMFLNLLLTPITSSDVYFCSMASISVPSFSDFILYILLKCSAPFNTFWRLMCSSPFLCIYSVTVPLTQFVFLQFSYLTIVQENYFCLRLLQKRNLPFQLSFRCTCIFFT